MTIIQFVVPYGRNFTGAQFSALLHHCFGR